ncbi:MAG: GNAT family N-acetyltransferase [Desulfobacterales bacterium]|jgi:GNAT superfamily N-acetyltransferase
MIDASKYDQIETLKNGTAVRIRAIRSDDKGRLSEAFRNLETESIYTRFFSHKKALSEAELKAATEVDFEKVVALVVTVGEGKNETIIAGGRYATFETTDSRRSAEVSFTVEEDYQGQGLAGRLLRHLVQIAREEGVSQFEAEVLSGNKAMLTVFSRSGLPINKSYADGVTHVTLSLAEPAA